MKLRVVAIGVVSLCMSSWSLNKNQSIEFTQSLNRNASTDADAAFHNPAGTAFLPVDGFYVGGGSQLVLQQIGVEEKTPLLGAYARTKYDGSVVIPFFPTLQAAYKKGDLSVFLHAGPLAGGGEGEYDDGLPKFDNMILGFTDGVAGSVKTLVDLGYQQQLAGAGITGVHVTDSAKVGMLYKRSLSFTGDVKTLGATGGLAYKALPVLSVSAAYRFSYAYNTYKGSAKPSTLDVQFQGSKGLAAAGISGTSVDSTLTATANHVIDSLWRDISVDVTQTGVSHSVVVGLDFKPDEIWNVGLRFEWNGEMEVENTESSISAPDALMPNLAGFAKGAKSKITEPMVLAGGVSWKGVKDLTLESSVTYGFAENVDHDGAEKNYHNSIMAGLGARYKVTPSVETALGYAYDAVYMDDDARDEANFDPPTHYMSLGAGWQATPRLRLDCGAMLGFSPDTHATGVTGARQTLSSTIQTFGLGLEWSPEI